MILCFIGFGSLNILRWHNRVYSVSPKAPSGLFENCESCKLELRPNRYRSESACRYLTFTLAYPSRRRLLLQKKKKKKRIEKKKRMKGKNERKRVGQTLYDASGLRVWRRISYVYKSSNVARSLSHGEPHRLYGNPLSRSQLDGNKGEPKTRANTPPPTFNPYRKHIFQIRVRFYFLLLLWLPSSF